MILVEAKILLYQGGDKRITPFKSGYRPLFDFGEKSLTSGEISFTNKRDFYPGETGVVKIRFRSDEYLGSQFGIGTKFVFLEAKEPLGEGVVLQVNEVTS